MLEKLHSTRPRRHCPCGLFATVLQWQPCRQNSPKHTHKRTSRQRKLKPVGAKNFFQINTNSQTSRSFPPPAGDLFSPKKPPSTGRRLPSFLRKFVNPPTHSLSSLLPMTTSTGAITIVGVMCVYHEHELLCVHVHEARSYEKNENFTAWADVRLSQYANVLPRLLARPAAGDKQGSNRKFLFVVELNFPLIIPSGFAREPAHRSPPPNLSLQFTVVAKFRPRLRVS